MISKYNSDYGEDIYNIVSKLVKLNFKSQIKGSGITFNGIYHMIDLVSEKGNCYELYINDTLISFKNREEFIREFIILLKSSIATLNQESRDLEENSHNDAIFDKYTFHMERERIGYCGNKQLE